MPYVFGDLGAAPCPPPGGCPAGTKQNPNYPEHSATCCKSIPGYVAPPVVPGGTTPPVVPGPEGPAGGPAVTAPWYKNLGQYKWYILGSSAVLVTGIVAAVLLRKPPAPATADWEW
jgi:hypothetical protein